MVEELLTDTKLVRIPKELANQLRIVSSRLGTNVTDFAAEALSQAAHQAGNGQEVPLVRDILLDPGHHPAHSLTPAPKIKHG